MSAAATGWRIDFPGSCMMQQGTMRDTDRKPEAIGLLRAESCKRVWQPLLRLDRRHSALRFRNTIDPGR
jgi:hypothetical protein